MENEYEVESILKAKVFMRGKKMGWKFYVKWKGYEDTENTWEPFKSFEGSGEEMVERFWDCVDKKGRDINSIEGWASGEEVFPTRSPRRKGRPVSRKDNLTDSRPSTDEHPPLKRTPSGKRTKRPLEDLEPEIPSKRKRAGRRRKSDLQPTRHTLHGSPTPVPDSQSESEMLVDSLSKTASGGRPVSVGPSEQVERAELGDSAPSSVCVQSQLPDGDRLPKSSRKLEHVKPQSPIPNLPTDDAIPSPSPPGSRDEADLLQESTVPQTLGGKKSRRGLKGRNASLLTFSKKKGTLETIRRSRSVKDDDSPQDTDEVLELLESNSNPLDSVASGTGFSSAENLLQGKNSAATTSGKRRLVNNGEDEARKPSDFDEQSLPISPSSPTFELPEKMPTSISFPDPTPDGGSPWKRATIFGPLSIGAVPQPWVSPSASPTGISSPSIQKSFLLTIDNSNSIPVVLKDVSLPQSFQDLHIENIIPGTPGPPGKLYTSHAATALLETLETGGSCARLVPDETATPDQRLLFDAFCRKLGEGGLFVVMASSEVLACCSSTNECHTKKLALAASLQGLSDTVVVSHVKVANYSAFADAAAQAENIRW